MLKNLISIPAITQNVIKSLRLHNFQLLRIRDHRRIKALVPWTIPAAKYISQLDFINYQKRNPHDLLK